MQNRHIYSALALHLTTVKMLRKIQWHAVPGTWTKNNTSAVEHVLQLFWQSKMDETKTVRTNQFLFLFDCTSNLGIVGHADSTDPVVGYRGHLSCTTCSMPKKEEEWEREECFRETSYPSKCHLLNDAALYAVYIPTGSVHVYQCLLVECIPLSCRLRQHKLMQTGSLLWLFFKKKKS